MNYINKKYLLKDMKIKRNLFGIYLKERRSVLGLTQTEVANLLGVQTSVVRKWEQGSDFPALEMHHKIPTCYQITEIEWHSIVDEELDHRRVADVQC